MNIWLTVRTFIAAFLLIWGLGLTFVPSGDDLKKMVGAVFAALGVTFLLRLAIALRRS